MSGSGAIAQPHPYTIVSREVDGRRLARMRHVPLVQRVDAINLETRFPRRFRIEAPSLRRGRRAAQCTGSQDGSGT